MANDLKTSLGIWAIGRDGHPLRARRLPARARAARPPPRRCAARSRASATSSTTTSSTTRRSCRPTTSTRSARRSTATASTASRPACTSTRSSAAAGSSRPTARSARRRVRRTVEAADFAGADRRALHHLARDRGLQLPLPDALRRVVGAGSSRASARPPACDRADGRKLFLEHKNSEPAMKILMRNIGMTLHVIHKLRAEGVDNVQVNMDWQHLLMNGENLAEYAAMLAAEGLLGHQHANSGWGTFDDDNMVGATAFMETVELALELRRAKYGSNGERLGLDLFPYTEDQVAAVRRSVEQWRFIDASPSASTTPRCARRSSARTRSPRTSSCTRRWGRPRRSHDAPRRPRRRHHVGQGHRDRPERRGRPRRRARLPAVDPAAGLERAGPRALVEGRRRGARRVRGRPRARHRAVRPDARPRRAGRATTGRCARRSSGTTGARRSSATRSRSASGASG